MLLNEFKPVVKSTAKLMLLPILTAAILIAAVFSAYSVLTGGGENSLALIKIGVVNLDKGRFTGAMFEGFNSLGILNGILRLEMVDLDEAERRIEDDSLAAYVVIPERYASIVSGGGMSEVTLVCNGSKPLESAIITLAAKSGVAFVRTGQAGVFAALDFAEENAIAPENFDRDVVVPVNMMYVNLFLNYNNMYDFKNISLTGEYTIADFYTRVFSFFFITVTLLFFYPAYKGLFDGRILAVCRAAKIPPVRSVLFKQLALFAVLAAAYSPFILVFGVYYPAVIFCAAGLLLFVSAFYRETSGGVIFILVYSLLDLYCAGGIIPVSLFPRGLAAVRFAAMHNYAVGIRESWWALLLFGLVFTAAAVFKVRRKI